jgi:hypothetical protein
MNKIQTLDPYLSAYIYEKSENPDAPIVWRQFEKRMVDKVDRIVELSKGHRESIVSNNDWEVMGELLKFFAEEWPEEFEPFKKQMSDIRSSRRADGYSQTREIRFVAALPPRFERIIKAVFPFQSFDKKFVNKLARKFPVFKVGGEGNMSKGTVII